MTDRVLMEKYQHQAEMLANKVKKKYKHLRKRYAREKIEVYRLYDWDIPEIRAVVDWYAGHLVVGEYTRTQSTPEWLPMMGKAAAEVLDVPVEKVYLKERRSGKLDGKRYERIDYTDKKLVVSERDLKFYVNPYDYVDTGLFSDHRNTRMMIREAAVGKDFLNLYCYTGSFTCYAAKGGAASTVSVDRSLTAVNWTKENMALNQIPAQGNVVVHSHTEDFLKKAIRQGQKFDLAVVDPPSYSTTRMREGEFDVLRDHPALLINVVQLMREEGVIIFSTNHQSFTPLFEKLPVRSVEEITRMTIPEDYVNKRKNIHRCWKISV